MTTATSLKELPITIGALPGDGQLPLVVSPASADRDAGDLAAWLENRPAWVADRLLVQGALLFRGFDIRKPDQFERVARAVAPRLQNTYLGTSPRDALTDYVFSASELPPYFPIPQHLEMSFVPDPPERLFFHCMVAPSGEGGETPLVDFRQVLRDLDPEVRRQFETRGVRNIRNYSGPDGGSRWDLWKLKRWDEMFQTTDRARVEAIAREQRFEVTWKESGRLALTNTQPAVRAHPASGEPVWSNHSQVFHLSAAAGEYRRIARRQRPLASRALALLARALVAAKRLTTPLEDQAMHCTYGDGTEIPDADMEKVRDAIWKNMIFFRWRQGDVVAIDNRSVAHGRMPYRGARTVTVCWA